MYVDIVISNIFNLNKLFFFISWEMLSRFLEYCSAVWCSAADTHRKLLDSGARFLTRGVFECNIAHR